MLVITNQITSWIRVLPDNLINPQLVNKFLAFYETQRLIISFTTSRQLSLSRARTILSTLPYATYWRSILIYSAYLRLGLPSGLFPSRFLARTLRASLLFHTCHMPRPSHSSWFDHPNKIGEEYRSESSSLFSTDQKAPRYLVQIRKLLAI